MSREEKEAMSSPLYFDIDMDMYSSGSHKFGRISWRSERACIGDFDVTVLLGSLELALDDLIRRLSGEQIEFVGNYECESVFLALNTAVWDGNVDDLSSLAGIKCDVLDARNCLAVPTGIESFDGEAAFIYKGESGYFFSWRDWVSKAIECAPIEKSDFLSRLVISLNKIRAFK
ncbi:hypothetical protein [Paraburkholderia caribensis]|uniref:hypothetical protein n=1 Tax=Paraburkholderia caribensis TaxID=75105 RepID=UPI0011DF411F|nr:hypothetical protein [Paraburkholderia caribensis]